MKESASAHEIQLMDTRDCSRTEPAIPDVKALPTAVVREADAPSRVITVTDASEGTPSPRLLTAKTLNAAVIPNSSPSILASRTLGIVFPSKTRNPDEPCCVVSTKIEGFDPKRRPLVGTRRGTSPISVTKVTMYDLLFEIGS